MGSKELFVVGCAAGIGFTVALFVATVAFPPGGVQDAAKMGALGSFAAAIMTIAIAKMMKIAKIEGDANSGGHGH
jgi:NhaA family Na+:H+ antiporter